MSHETRIVRVRQKATILVSYNNRSFGTPTASETLANVDFTQAILSIIPGITPAGTIAGTENVAIIQNGQGRVATINAIVAGSSAISDLQQQIDNLPSGGGGGGGGGTDARVDILVASESTFGSVAYAVKQEADRAKLAENVLDNRLDTLESDISVVGSVAYSVKQEADRAELAENALDNRLDTLESDMSVVGSVAYAVKQEADRATAEEADIRSSFAAADSSTLQTAKNYADGKIASLIGTAPEILDTLGEIATALQDEQTATTAILSAISNEVTRATGAENLLDGRLDTLEASNTTPGSVAYAVKVETDRAIASEANLQSQIDGLGNISDFDARLDVLEGPNTIEGSVSYAVKTETDRAVAAEAALQGQINAFNSSIYNVYLIQSEVTSNVTTLSNLPGLVFSVEPNAIYRVEIMYLFSTSINTTGMRLGYLSTNCTATGNYIVPVSLSGGAILSNRTSGAASLSTGVDVANQNLLALGTFLVVGGVDVGQFQLQFASEVAATSATIKLGSNMRVVRLA